MSNRGKKPKGRDAKKIVSPDINKIEEAHPGRTITAAELRSMDKLKHGGHPSRNQNYRVNKTSRDFE